MKTAVFQEADGKKAVVPVFCRSRPRFPPPRAGSAKGRPGAAAAKARNKRSPRRREASWHGFWQSGRAWAGGWVRMRPQNPCQDARHAMHHRTSASRRRRARPKRIPPVWEEARDRTNQSHFRLIRARPRAHPPALFGKRGRLWRRILSGIFAMAYLSGSNLGGKREITEQKTNDKAPRRIPNSKNAVETNREPARCGDAIRGCQKHPILA